MKSNSKQIRRSLKTDDRRLAERRLPDFRDKIDRIDLSSGKSKLAFEELAEKWRATLAAHLKPTSAKRGDVNIIQLTRFFKTQSVRGITKAMCEEWAQQRSPEIAASTFNNERETLIAILDDALRETATAAWIRKSSCQIASPFS